MRVRTERRGDTRQRILDSALHLFAERGYAGTSIRDIAEELDVTKAAVHYHFPSKEQIVQALLAPFVGDFSRIVTEQEASTAPTEPRTLLLQLRQLLDEANPLLSVLTADPSIAAACTDLHHDAKQMGHRLAVALVGPKASPATLLRAHACLGAFFAGYDVALKKRGGKVSAADAEVVLTAALAALG